MSSITNDWKPVVKNLLTKLDKAGFKILAVDDGGDEDEVHHNPTMEEAVAAVTSVDESHITAKAPDGKNVWLYIVLGNSPDETVSDYTVHAELEPVIDAFSAEWEGVPVPTSESKVKNSPTELLDLINKIHANAGESPEWIRARIEEVINN